MSAEQSARIAGFFFVDRRVETDFKGATQREFSLKTCFVQDGWTFFKRQTISKRKLEIEHFRFNFFQSVISFGLDSSCVSDG